MDASVLGAGPSPRRRGLVAAIVVAALALAGGGVGFGAAALAAAGRSDRAAGVWRQRAEEAAMRVQRQLDEQERLQRELTEATTEAAGLRGELDAERAQLAAARAQLADTTALLVRTEDRVAELAGAAALQRDRAALGG